MKNSIKGTMCKFGLILFLMMFSISGMAQTRYTMSLTATAPTDKTIDVTLSITANSAGGEKFGGYSTGINFNTAAINGGTISAAYVANSKASELAAMVIPTPGVATTGHIRLSLQALSGANGVDMVQGTTFILGTYRITNTVAWASGSNASMWLQNVLATGKTNSLVNGYPFGATTGAVSITTTAPVAGALALGYTQASPFSLLLNVPSEICFTSGSQTATTPPTCAGDSNGSATVTMSPIPSSLSVTYVLEGGAETPVTLSAGGTFTLTGLTSGSHTLAVTGNGTCSTPVSVTDVLIGAGTALSTPTVGLTSSDLDNTLVSGTSVTFTATAGSLAGGTASYDFKVNGSSVQSGASNTFATSNLANNDQVSVDITVTGGTCLSSTTAISNTINNTVTTYFASVTSYCGLTMPKLASTIYCSIPSGVTGTLTYRFKVRKTGTLDAEIIVNRTVNSFNLSLLPTIASYSTGYDVRVAAVVDGLEQPTSAVCVVTTPSTPPAVSINQCGATLAALNSVISVNALTGATSFRYAVALSTAPTVFYTLTSSNSSFRLTDVPGLTVEYSKTYSVSAQQFVSNGGEFVWSPSGRCNVFTPSVANAINLQINQCGQTLATIKTKLTVNGVANATLYTYRVSTQADFSSPVQDITTPNPSFSMNSLTTVPLIYGSEYFVKVKVAVTINSVTTESNFGTPCSFFTPEAVLVRAIAKPFMATAYPNPFANNFMIDVTTSTKENINIKVYDMVGRLIDQRDETANDLKSSTIGDGYPSGVYNVIVTQGTEMKTLRVVKR